MFERRGQGNSFAISLRAHVGQILGFAGVDHHIGRAGVFSHDHACIDIFLRSDKEGAALLQIIEGVGHRGAPLQSDQHAVDAAGDFTAEGAVLSEKVGNDPHTFSQIL